MSKSGNPRFPRSKNLAAGALVFGLLALGFVIVRKTLSGEPPAAEGVPTSSPFAGTGGQGAPPSLPGDDDIVIDEKLYEWSPSEVPVTPVAKATRGP